MGIEPLRFRKFCEDGALDLLEGLSNNSPRSDVGGHAPTKRLILMLRGASVI